jgi:PAS domain S-box-containing protein
MSTGQRLPQPPAEPAPLARLDPPLGSPARLLGDLARIAATVCNTPWASISLTEGHTVGSSPDAALDVSEVPNCTAFCDYAMRAGRLFEVEDAGRDLRFSATESMARPLSVRFYAGVPLLTEDGRVLGTLSVLDRERRRLSPVQRDLLLLLAAQGASHAEHGAGLHEARSSVAERATFAHPDATSLIRALAENALVAIYHADATGQISYVNPEYRAIFGLRPDQSLDEWARGVHPDDRVRMEQAWADFCRHPRPVEFQYRTQPREGVTRFLAERVAVVTTPGVSGFVGTIADVTELHEVHAELETIYKQLVDASRLAGMAEVATNVLHNVGNVLNSVNVCVSRVGEHLRQSKAAGLGKVAGLLKEHEADLASFVATDARGRRLPTYLAQLAERLDADQRVALEELAALQSHIEHIKETVIMQQSYAKLCGVTETVAVASLVEDCLRMNTGALARHGVAVRREIADIPPITIDKHKVLQILVNLVRNAKYACDESSRSDRLVIVRVEAAGTRVRLSVIDNGVGIASEDMPRLFSHGFTTRKSGHGFGLHSASLAARELGGTLTAHSDGRGQGATFILELPRETPRG